MLLKDNNDVLKRYYIIIKGIGRKTQPKPLCIKSDSHYVKEKSQTIYSFTSFSLIVTPSYLIMI